MDISSICTRRMVTVDGGSTLHHAAITMREQHVGALIVTQQTGADGCVVGIVTDRDLVIDVLARGVNPANIKVGDLANEPHASVREDADLTSGMAVMEQYGVRRALVTDAQDRVIGILSLDDMMDACAQELAGLSRVIRSGLQREASENDATEPGSPLPLRIPSIGTVGWNTVLE